MKNNTEIAEKYLALLKEHGQFLNDAIATEKQLQLNKAALELVSEKYAALRAKCEKMEIAIKNALRIKALWGCTGDVSIEHSEEAAAIISMEYAFNSALEQEGEKEPVAQQGAVWVKASERLPVNDGLYCFKANGGYFGAYVATDGNGTRWVRDSGGGTVRNWKHLEWLDEAGKEVKL
jgi:hypothetical protein